MQVLFLNNSEFYGLQVKLIMTFDLYSLQVPASSLIFFILFAGNMSTTLRVVLDKVASSKKALAKQEKKKE